MLDDISLDSPREWRVFKLDAGSQLPAGTRMDIYRLQRGSGESVTAPILLDLSSDDSSQAKIVFGEEPLALIDQPSTQQREALLQTMVAVAKVLNDEETNAEPLNLDQARERAGALMRSMLPKDIGSKKTV